MERKLAYGMLSLLLLSTFTLAFYVVPVSASLPVHNIDTGEDFATIQEAIDDPDTLDGHTIFVEEGIYFENVVVDKSVSLLGESKFTTIIDGSRTGNGIHIVANSVTIKSFTVRNGSSHDLYGIFLGSASRGTLISNNTIRNYYYGIGLEHTRNNNIEANNLTNNFVGIRLWDDSDDTIIRSNIIDSSNRFSIQMRYSSRNFIDGNIMTDNRNGIWMVNCENNTLKDNHLTNVTEKQGRPIYISGKYLSNFLHDIDTSNTLDDKQIYYLVNQRNLTIKHNTFPNIAYLALINSASITIRNLTQTDTQDGIFLAYTNNSVIENLDISNNFYGIRLVSSSNNSVCGNNITGSESGGIYLGPDSDSNHIILNKVSSNSWGISVYQSDWNDVERNSVTLNRFFGVNIDESSENVVFNNTISSNENGVCLYHSEGNTVHDNTVSINSDHGVYLYDSSSNTVASNDLLDNNCGIGAKHLGSNMLYHNNFINNTQQICNYPWNSDYTINFWDDGHPSGGNYLSDYNGTDFFSGPYQNVTGSDGIGDTPYVIDANNKDNYPLMNPWGASPSPDTTLPTFSIVSPENKTYSVNDVSLTFIVDESTSWIGYSLDGQMNVTISGNTTIVGLSYGTHTVTVYANDTAGNMGISEMIYFTVETQVEPQQAEAFPTWIVALLMIIPVVGAVVFVYFTKFK